LYNPVFFSVEDITVHLSDNTCYGLSKSFGIAGEEEEIKDRERIEGSNGGKIKDGSTEENRKL
jgi:hypothetical protein